MINIINVFKELRMGKVGVQKKLTVENCELKIFCALATNGNYRLSILTSQPAVSIDSTKALKLIQGIESENAYWTCFELLDNSASNVFYSLCSDLISSTIGCKTEKEAMSCLVNRYYAWSVMFKKSRPMSEEKIKGLFGELYFLNEYMIPKYGINKAISAWSGPDGTSKDFSIDDTWYEVKTISTISQVVKISSLAQLSAENTGYLCVVRTEKMSKEYNDGKCSINDMFNIIMNQIEANEIKEQFVSKLMDYGFDITDDTTNYKLKVDAKWMYLVKEDFPRIVERDVKFEEIGRVTYELILGAIEKFRVEG